MNPRMYERLYGVRQVVVLGVPMLVLLVVAGGIYAAASLTPAGGETPTPSVAARATNTVPHTEIAGPVESSSTPIATPEVTQQVTQTPAATSVASVSVGSATATAGQSASATTVAQQGASATDTAKAASGNGGQASSSTTATNVTESTPMGVPTVEVGDTPTGLSTPAEPSPAATSVASGGATNQSGGATDPTSGTTVAPGDQGSEGGAQPQPTAGASGGTSETGLGSQSAAIAPRLVVNGKYRVRNGDNLWVIARDLCHSGFNWVKIYRANRALIRNPNLIYPNQVFEVPCIP
jgi:nucleoid-associated protein YgaU